MVDSLTVRGEITTRTHDPAVLAYHDHTFPALPRDAKAAVAGEHPPLDETTTHNTTCVGFHEWLVDAVDGASVAPPEPSDFALGRSNTTPSVNDRSLNDEVDRVDITNFSNEGTTIRISSYVGEDEANVDTAAGETISEGGVYASETLLNHSLFDVEYEKDSSKSMSVEAAFTFDAA